MRRPLILPNEELLPALAKSRKGLLLGRSSKALEARERKLRCDRNRGPVTASTIPLPNVKPLALFVVSCVAPLVVGSRARSFADNISRGGRAIA